MYFSYCRQKSKRAFELHTVTVGRAFELNRITIGGTAMNQSPSPTKSFKQDNLDHRVNQKV
jgi:hypothetical protein